MLVTSPLGYSVKVNRVYKNCHLMTHDREFSTDLLALPFHEFDLILGMDWLSKHRAIVDCDKKTVRLKCSCDAPNPEGLVDNPSTRGNL